MGSQRARAPEGPVDLDSSSRSAFPLEALGLRGALGGEELAPFSFALDSASEAPQNKHAEFPHSHFKDVQTKVQRSRSLLGGGGRSRWSCGLFGQKPIGLLTPASDSSFPVQ